ncbi:MAG: helix-turn-helix domain-containing protein [Candidatus Kerfeldbacteria bacterium]|nr:helix-turn-helix domain-containing protein [Candidatus Kerfeldbacteria bacterium]
MDKAVFDLLGIPENATRIYERLLGSGPLSARQLAENLGLPRPSVYDHLKLLMKSGLVVERDEEHTKVFQVDDVRHLSQLLQFKIERLQQEDRRLKTVLPSMLKQSRSIEPRMKFYPGAEGVKHVLRDTLWYNGIEVVSMWPFREMVDVLGADYMANFHRRRIRLGISIRTLWPRDKAVSFKDAPYLGVGKKFLREQRFAPEGISWDMGHVIYEDKVGFISSKQEAFGFTVQSREFTELMKLQFEVLWKLSTPVKPQPQYSEAFLKTV